MDAEAFNIDWTLLHKGLGLYMSCFFLFFFLERTLKTPLAAVLNMRNLRWKLHLSTKGSKCFYGTPLQGLFAENVAIFLSGCISKIRIILCKSLNFHIWSTSGWFISFCNVARFEETCLSGFHKTWIWCTFHVTFLGLSLFFFSGISLKSISRSG